MSYGLVKLSTAVDWDRLNELFLGTFHLDKGRPGINTRLIVALHYLKYIIYIKFFGIKANYALFFFRSLIRWVTKVVGDGTRALIPSSENMQAGYYKVRQLSDIDVDLATPNIRSGAEIFGIEGTGDRV